MRTIDHAAFAVNFGRRVLKLHSPVKMISFLLGNLAPDYSYHTYCRSIGHGFRTARKKLVLAWRCRYEKGETAAFYYRLGVAAHYICDSFTYPHNRQFEGTLSDHVRYENRLHEVFLKKGLADLPDAPVFDTPEGCMRYLERSHKAYLKLPERTPSADFESIWAACRTALMSSFEIPKDRRIDFRRILEV